MKRDQHTGSQNSESMFPDIEISGSGKIAAGHYGKVEISGSGRCDGDIICTKCDVAGSMKTEGSITAEEKIDISGSFKGKGNITCRDFEVAGSATVEGTIETSGKTDISGSLRCGSLSCGRVSIAGLIKAEGNVEAEQAEFDGGGEIKGLLNAENIRIRLAGKPESFRAGSIGGSRILAMRAKTTEFFSKITSLSLLTGGRLTADLIEGDDIDLIQTDCPKVSGARVIIRSGCRIGLVEYTESLQVEEGAVVERREKV